MSTVLCGWIGWRVDARFESEPFGFVIGVALGFALGMVSLFRGLSVGKPPVEGNRTSGTEGAPDEPRSSDPPQ